MRVHSFGLSRPVLFLLVVVWIAARGNVLTQTADQGPLTLTVMDAPGPLKPDGAHRRGCRTSGPLLGRDIA